MKLRLHTDYALRVLLFLAYTKRKVTNAELADAYDISRDHVVKVVQELSRLGLVRTMAGRNGGLCLAEDPDAITVRQVVEQLEGRSGILDCVRQPATCPVEPGCSLRVLLMEAEASFYETLATKTIGDLVRGRKRGGLVNLGI